MTDNPEQPSTDGPSIRDRLRAPATSDQANTGGDSRGSDVTDASFVATDSAAVAVTHHAHRPAPAGHDSPPPAAAELSESAAAKAERKIAALFVLSFLGVIGFFVVYLFAPFAFTARNNVYFTPLLALSMTVALGALGVGAVKWAKDLMPAEESIQERHGFASEPADRSAAAALLESGLQETGLPRRKLLRNTLLLSGLSLPAMALPLLFDLGRYAHKERQLSTTAWRAGARLIRQNGTPIRLGDLDIGGIETVFPDVPGGTTTGDSPTMLIRMRPEDLHPAKGRETWSVDGHIAYSMICTHLGCPVKLYEQQTHHLFCPCHQSTFDASRAARVIFGPAARALPQLAIRVDAEGYFVAQGDYSEPIGPSFWERKP